MSGENQIPRIFICYAHKDNESDDPSKRWLDRLLEQLEPLNLQKQALIWSDQRLELGEEWHQEIQNTLGQVRAAILLVSPSFLASKYIRNSEVPVLLKNAKDKGVVIIPIILRSCLFKETKFKYPDPQKGQKELSLSVFQAAGSPTKPLNGLPEHEQDKVLLSVAQRLLKIVSSHEERASSSSFVDIRIKEPDIGETATQPRTAMSPKAKRFPWGLIVLGGVTISIGLVAALSFFHPWDSFLPPPTPSPTPSSPAPVTSAAQVGVQTVRLQYPKGRTRMTHGFLAHNGYVITVKSENPTEVTVSWESDNKKQKAQARFEKTGGRKAPQVMLLKLQGANLPHQVLPVRNSSSLKVGDPVERYLAPHDRTPGKVLEVGGTTKIWGLENSSTTLKNALITTKISAVGEAGAPVVDAEGKVVAMVYGASRAETVSIPIEDIKIIFPEAFSPH